MQSAFLLLQTGLTEPHTIRSRLTLLVLACVIPAWVASGGMLYYTYQAKRSMTERHMIDTVHALSLMVDREFSRV
ncbi:MAG: hypothetical protein WCF85_02155 [Rhodospirillaceae bacterium]